MGPLFPKRGNPGVLNSYLLYGPLACVTTLMFEGVPNWPTPARMAQVVDKHQVNILYTAPTAIRALMAEGDKAIEGTDRSSLRILGSVGEPINPEAWEWYWKKNRQRENVRWSIPGGRPKPAVS